MLFAVAGCSGNGISGNGHIVTANRSLASFENVDVSGALNVMINAGSAQKVNVTADSNIMNEIETTVTNDTLYIKTNPKALINPTQTPVVTLRVKNLNDLTTSGLVKANVDNLKTVTLKVKSIGAGDIYLRGEADNVWIETKGAAKINAIPLEANRVDIKIMGAGKVSVNALKTLNVNIAGAGKVLYVGNPVMTKSVTGMGQISKLKQ
jgi:hypothetical protein